MPPSTVFPDVIGSSRVPPLPGQSGMFDSASAGEGTRVYDATYGMYTTALPHDLASLDNYNYHDDQMGILDGDYSFKDYSWYRDYGEEVLCEVTFLLDPYPATVDGRLYCNSTWDSVSCWPTTLAGQLSVISCPENVEGVKYDSSQNASRMCYENGTFDSKSNYSACTPLPMPGGELDLHNYITRVIYYVGFTASIIALIIALSIFFYFRSLRCLRNTIHCQLMVTFLLRNLLWLVMNNVLSSHSKDENKQVYQWICKLMVAVYNYFQVTNFFWMLVEGLYLHTMIVWAFQIEKIRFWYYAVLGWCAPAVVVLVWGIVKLKYENKSCWLPIPNTYYDYIYIAPILIVLLVNLIFLASIVYVLITKLRASNTMQARQYKKAVKATLILFPLLGVTYVLFIAPPGDDIVSKAIFVYFNVILQSTQGLAVAVFYCFLNGEVRATIKTRFNRWQDTRSIATRYSRASVTLNQEQLGMTRSSRHGSGGGAAGPSAVVTKKDNGSPKKVATNGMTPKDSQKNNNDNGYSCAGTPMLNDEAL